MSSANSAISSHTKYSAKSTNTANQNNQNGAGGAYGSKTKQQIAEEVELAEDDIMKKYLETQDKHRQLMNENSKRRKEKEKKMKEEQEKKRKQEEEMLLKRKETKQQAYVKFLRSNATKVADNLKQNTEQVNGNGNGTKVKSSTANQPKRPTYKVTQLEQNKAVANDQPKPKKQWNTAKTSNQNLVADEKITAQKENRMPVPLAEYYGKQKDSKEKQQEVYSKDMNLDALDLNIPSGKDDFDRIKKMYAKQNHDSNGNDFIVNFEKEWKDDEDSLDNIRQSKLLESLDLSTVKTRKAKNAPPQEPIAVKPKKNIKSQFDDIYENDSYDENEQEDIEEEEAKDKRQKVNQNGVKKGSNENLQTQSKPSRAELLQQMKKGGVSKQNEQEDKVVKDRKNTQPKNINMKNESALVREAIGFDEHFIAEDSDDDDIGTALGFQAKQQQKKPQEKRNSQANESKSNVEEGLTFAKLQKLNEVMEGTVALDNQKYDVLSWAKNQQKEVDDVFSQAPSNLTQNRVKPVSAKQFKDDKKPPILRSNTNNNIYQENKPNNAAQQKKQQEQQDAQSYISEDRMQRQSIRQLSASRNVQKQPEQISPNQQKQNKQQPSERTQITTNIQQQQKGRAQADRSKERQPVPPVMQVPPSKQKYTNIHNNKVNQSHNDGSSEVASSNQGRVSKFKQKLQWNVQNNRRNNTKSPDSVGTRDEDINVDEFLRDDLLNINQEEQQLQQEIYALHFDNVEKIRDIENRNNINLNLVSSKQVKYLENNPSTVVKPIKPIYEYKEEELEQSLLRLDKALVLKKNKPQSANIARQQNGQTGEADNEQFSLQAMYQMQQQLQQNQKGMKQPLQKPNNPQTKQQQVQSGQQFNMNQNMQMLQQQQLQQQQQQQQQQQLLQQQQLNNAVPNNLIAQQLLILQQQQQLLLQQQQQMAVAQIQNGNLNNIGLNSPPNLQNNQMNTMKIQQILNVNQLTYQNLAQQNESLTKLEKGYDVNRQEGNAVNQQESRDQSMYISPQFGMIGNSKSNQQLNNNIKNVTGNMSVTSLHSQQQYQSQYNYDINDLQSISQVNSVAPSINPEVRRQKLREELDEEVESKISEMKSKISSNNNNNNNNNKEQQNSYKQKHVIKKDIKQKKGQAQEEKSLKKEIEENPDGMMKFAGNNKLKALLLDDVEEEQDSRHYQDNSFE